MTSLLSNSIKTSTKEAFVNTPTDIDLSFQRHALTERCITLENRLIEEKSLTLKLQEANSGPSIEPSIQYNHFQMWERKRTNLLS